MAGQHDDMAKPLTMTLEHSGPLHVNSHSTLEEASVVDEKKVLRKMDLRLIPIVSALYLLCFLDRGNIGNARIEGLLEDINLTSPQYNMCLTAFFFTYALFELPSNMVLKRLRPSVWLSAIMVGVGIVMTLMGIVQNYHGLLISRIFLGLAEAGLFPGVAFYITTWYCRHEAQLRLALFFSGASIAGAFSGLLAFAIAANGWRWIFILEGLLTVIVSASAFFIISDYPHEAKFLSEDEKAWVIQRLETQFGTNVEGSKSFQWSHVWEVVSDYHIWVGVVALWGIIVPLYGISFFLPSIIRDLGYSSSNAQLLTVPIYVGGAIFGVVSAWLSDRAKKRSPFLVFHCCCIIIGFTIVIASTGRGVPGVVYFGIFLAVSGIYPGIPSIVNWIGNNLAGDSKRALGLGLHIGMGNMGGAMASNFYRAQDAPNYYLGHGLELGFAVAGLIAVVTLRILYQRANKARGEEGTGNLTANEMARLGDKSPAFRYML
ncbi:putative MFS nicotinic acid transporter Tna1 [Aspergillus keveii]|uniref:MFS nicotinic acid transporter Tna1 n=1 Tax=Aspergillus keveii TaxID=714993 RepID=A0ABR4FMT8_9EURO